MAKGAGAMVAFMSGAFGFVGILFVTIFPEWAINSQQSSEEYVKNQHYFQGIWWRCTSAQPGLFQCDNYDVSIVGLDPDIQACRALMCIACGFSFFGLVASLLSLDCTTAVEPDTKSKDTTALAAGVCHLIAGLTCGGAVSYFAWKVTYEFYNPLYKEREFKYEYGACLYVGWVSMLLALIASLILIVGSCQNMRSNNDEYSPNPYTYHPPQSKTTKSTGEKAEYV